MDLIIAGFKGFLGAQMSVPFRGAWGCVMGVSESPRLDGIFKESLVVLKRCSRKCGILFLEEINT